jgi:hypothetical protein
MAIPGKQSALLTAEILNLGAVSEAGYRCSMSFARFIRYELFKNCSLNPESDSYTEILTQVQLSLIRVSLQPFSVILCISISSQSSDNAPFLQGFWRILGFLTAHLKRFGDYAKVWISDLKSLRG